MAEVTIDNAINDGQDESNVASNIVFTADQVVRMQTIVESAPRRGSLLNSIDTEYPGGLSVSPDSYTVGTAKPRNREDCRKQERTVSVGAEVAFVPA